VRSYLPFVVIGLTTGAVYALAALGLVLTYRTSGVFNFGHGAIGMFATYLFYSLRQHMPTAVAILLAVLVVAPLMGVVIDQLFRRIAGAGATAAIVASIGLLVGLQGLAVVIYGGETRRMAGIFSTATYRAFDINIGLDQTMVVAIAVAGGLALIFFFRLTHLGLQTRAVVDNRSLTGLVGTSPNAVTRLSWMLGCSFAAISGILFSPFVGLDSLLITLLVVEAFGAAVVGRLRSFSVTALAAFGLGVAQSVATKVVGELGKPSLAGLPSAIPFLMLFAVIIFSRTGTLREAPTTRVVRTGGRMLARFRLPGRLMVLTVAVAAVLPAFLNGSQVLTLTSTVTFVLIFASLSLLIGLSRQLSLCHAVFVVFGATTLSHLQSAGVPYLAALVLSGLVLIPVGAALAIPAIRLSSLYLGLATFGFGILAQNLLFPTGLAFGSSGVITIARPGFLNGDKAFFYFVLGAVVLGIVVIELVRVTRLGRVLTALADSPTAVGSLGISPLAARVITFCLSAFFAGIAGALLGSLVRSVNPTSFHFFNSLVWVTVLVVAGAQTYGGVVLASLLLVTLPAVFTSSTVTEWQPVAFGAAAILFAQADNGLIGSLRRLSFGSLAERNRWRLGSARNVERLGRVMDGRPAPAAAGVQR
jgi:branched-subunit amino acid ABC-type transport system permease component